MAKTENLNSTSMNWLHKFYYWETSS